MFAENSHEVEVRIARRTLARVFVSGSGIEAGAGTRPWPLPEGTICHYGDIRSDEQLKEYFGAEVGEQSGLIDAQNFAGVPDEAYDFALSAHVIEHLIDPIGAIAAAARVVKRGGIVMFAIPDKRFTFDEPRPVTPLAHLVEDYRTGGEPTRLEGCMEHVRYLHPQWNPPIPAEEQEGAALALAARRGRDAFDTHFHTWTSETLAEMIVWIEANMSLEHLHSELAFNENIVVLRKR